MPKVKVNPKIPKTPKPQNPKTPVVSDWSNNSTLTIAADFLLYSRHRCRQGKLCAASPKWVHLQFTVKLFHVKMEKKSIVTCLYSWDWNISDLDHFWLPHLQRTCLFLIRLKHKLLTPLIIVPRTTLGRTKVLLLCQSKLASQISST
jgi:hypothetical protein